MTESLYGLQQNKNPPEYRGDLVCGLVMYGY